MHHQQISQPLNRLPLNIVFISNGHIGLVPQGAFPIIFDQPEQGIQAVIMSEGLLAGSTHVPYNTSLPYKEMPELLQWLQEQEIEMPTFGQMF